MAKKRRKKKEVAEVHEDLTGFNISIDAFGQMTSNTSADEIKAFLDEQISKKSSEEE